jgi:Fe-S cluster biogenesis protein NfuA
MEVATFGDGEVQVRLAGTCAECSAKAAERGLKRAA